MSAAMRASWAMAAGAMLLVLAAPGGDAEAQTPGFPVFPGKLVSNDIADQDWFASAVAISGNTAIVGAFGARGEQGAAYIFEQVDSSANDWHQVARLAPSGPGIVHGFGSSVAISGDTAVVGAPLEPFDGVTAPGAAYVFRRDQNGPNAWGEVARLTVSDGPPIHFLGQAVGISGDTVVVAADGRPATGALDPALPGGGAVYVFARDEGGPDAWGQIAKLNGDDERLLDQFARSVAISGETVIVGAPGCCGTNNGNGAAYVFQREAETGTWRQIAKLQPANQVTSETFGNKVAISGNTAIVSAPSSFCCADRRRAYIYSRNQGGADAWGEVQHRNFPLGVGDVAIDGDVAIVGTTGEDGRRLAAGTMHVLARNQGGPDAWGEVLMLAARDGAPHDEFGHAVSVSGAAVLVGAVLRGGVLTKSGAAYVCRLDALGQADAACIRPPVTVDTEIRVSDITTACCQNSEYVITAVFTNTSTRSITHPFIEVRELHGFEGEYTLKNADDGPGGVGAVLTPDVVDGLLSPGEATVVRFVIGLPNRRPFRFIVSVRADP
jgi:hypothetical protein